MGFFEELSSLDINDIGSWTRRVKLFMATLLGVLIVVAGFYFIISDQRGELESAKLQEPELKDQFLEKKALAINLDAYKAQMVEANNMFKLLKKQLPNESEIPDLLTDVTQVGITRGLQFEQIKPGNTVDRDFYAEKLVDIKVKGEYHQIAGFISDVAALPRIINVDNFALARQEPQGTQLTLTAVTKTYHYLDDDTGTEE